jgi:hypothetical protein
MPDQDPRRELALLVNSTYPIIYMETWEEARAAAILESAVEDLRVPFYEWAVTTGLARLGGAEIEEAVKSALYSALDRKAPLSSAILLEELRATYPLSVTMKGKIEALRDWARERAVPAN